MTGPLEATLLWALDSILPAILLWSALAVALLLLTAFLSDRWARVKSDLLVAAVLLLPLMVLIPGDLVTISGSYLPPPTVNRTLAVPATETAPSEIEPASSSSIASQTAESAIPWSGLFLAVWLAGAVVGLGRLALGAVRLTGVVRNAVPDGYWKGLAVRRSAAIRIPFATGLVRPLIMLPSEGPHEELILRHEAAHVLAGDVWALRLTLPIRALFWPHPLVWLLMRIAATNREIACDAVSVRGSDSVAYANLLLSFAALNASSEPSMAGAKDLSRRIRALGSGVNTASRRILWAPLAVLVIGLAMAGCRIEPGSVPPVRTVALADESISVVFRGDAEYEHMREALWLADLRPNAADWGGVRPVTVELTRNTPLSKEETQNLHGVNAVKQIRLKRGSNALCYSRKAVADEFVFVVEFSSGTLANEARSIVSGIVSGEICDVRKVANWVRIPNVPVDRRNDAVEALLDIPGVVSVDGILSQRDDALSPLWKSVVTATVQVEVPGSWEVHDHQVGERGFSFLTVHAPTADLSIQIETWRAGQMSSNQSKEWGDQSFLNRIRNAREVTRIEHILRDPNAKEEGSVVVEAAGGTYYATYATNGSLRYLILVGGDIGHRFMDIHRVIGSVRFTDGNISDNLNGSDRAQLERLLRPVEQSLDTFYSLVSDDDAGAADEEALLRARGLAQRGCVDIEAVLDGNLETFRPRARKANENPALGQTGLIGHHACRFATDYGDAFASRVANPERYEKFQLAVWDQSVKHFRKTWLTR